MNLFDWYFRQIVSQSEMDQAFEWAEDADKDMMRDVMMDPDPGGNLYGGIMDGGNTTEQAVPDLTVQVSAISAWGKLGERIKDVTPSVNVDVSQDEYGTSTAVTVGGESRIISIFARFKRNLTDPAVDGNGLTVYTKQLESMEYFVRMGTSAVTPTPPPLLSDALLLVDITRANGQTTIQNTDMDFSRREDWIRFTGTSIASFVHGTPKSALAEVFTILDTLSGGGAGFTFTEQWWFGQSVLGPSPPPATVGEALDAIVYDLAQAGSPQGSQYIGKAATTGTPGGYCDYAANNVSSFIINLCNTLAGHINGGAPNHPASTIATTAYEDLRFIHVTQASPLSGAGDITNDSGGEGTILYNYDPDSDWLLIKATVDTGWSTIGAGVDDANPFVAAEAYIIETSILVPNMLDGSDLQTVLEEMVRQIARRADIDDDHVVTGGRSFEGEFKTSRNLTAHNAAIGLGDPDGAIDQLEKGNWPVGGPTWPLGMDNVQMVDSIANLVDVARAWDFRVNRHAVLVVGDETRVGLVTFNPTSTTYLNDSFMYMTNNIGNRIEDDNPNAEPYAICSNGRQIFVLVGDATSPSPPGDSASIYCYDAAYWDDGDDMRYLWHTTVGSITGLGLRKTDSRIVANDTYVWALLAGENCISGTPLCRMLAADGTGAIRGKGDGSSAGTGTPLPCGGLCISGDEDVFYTCHNGAIIAETIPANSDLTSTTKGVMVSSGQDPCRDVSMMGRFVVCPVTRYPALAVMYLNTWDWVDDNQFIQDIFLPWVDNTYYGCQSSFDGTRLWVEYIDLRHLGTGEMRVVSSIHASQFIRYSDTDNPGDWPRFMLTSPRSGDFSYISNKGDQMGRIIAWGPGLWYIVQENDDNEVNFMPIAGLY